MKNRNIKLLTGSVLLSSILLSGCGGEADSGVTKQPHDTSKLGRTVGVEKDWTWNVSFSADIASGGNNTSVQANFWEGVPENIENFQTFIDMDSDANTGYSGPGTWEIDGADYLIENGDVYESLSTTEWKWKLIGSFQEVNKQSSGLGQYALLNMSNAESTLNNIFTTNNFKVMIEAYDANWQGDCNTITGIVADVSGVDIGNDDLVEIEKEIRAKHNAKFTTVTTIDFAPNKQEAIVAMINKWEGKNLYVINVSDTDTSTIFAKEYKNKFIYKTIVVKDNGIVEFQIKEDGGLKYKVVYDYTNNSEISKTLIEGNPEIVKKVLVKKSTDVKNDGDTDKISEYKYDLHGNITEQKNKYDFNWDNETYKTYTFYYTNTYDDAGNLIKVRKTDGEDYLLVTEYDTKGNPIKIDGDTFIEYISYTYADDGRILDKTRTIPEDDNYKEYSVYRYADNNNLRDIAVEVTQDWQPGYSYTDKEFIYDANGRVIREKDYEPSGSFKTIKFVYDDDGDILHEIVDKKGDGSIDEKIYNIYKKVALPN